jgi:hypothetical protein
MEGLDRGLGTRVLVQVDEVDASAPDFERVRGTVVRVFRSSSGDHDFIVQLDKPIQLSDRVQFGHILVVGIDMDLDQELFGTRQRPSGLPVLVALWRIRNENVLKRILETGRPLPGTEFLGRGELTLEDESPARLRC